jgi:hypothetical protein
MLIRWTTSALALGLLLTACGSGPGSDPVHAVLLADHGRSAAELEVTSGAMSITVRTGHQGGPLVRASTPAGSGVRPVLRAGRIIRVGLDQADGPRKAALTIWISPSVRWRVVLAGGADTLRLDLAGARLTSLDLIAGFSAISMRLPEPSGPSGLTTVVLAGGASNVRVRLPSGVLSQLVLRGGASFVSVGGRTRTGVAGGTVISSPGWAKSAARYLIDATAGISRISVTS